MLTIGSSDHLVRCACNSFYFLYATSNCSPCYQ